MIFSKENTSECLICSSSIRCLPLYEMLGRGSAGAFFSRHYISSVIVPRTLPSYKIQINFQASYPLLFFFDGWRSLRASLQTLFPALRVGGWELNGYANTLQTLLAAQKHEHPSIALMRFGWTT